ncbi:MAG: hypothetical protein IPK50_00855 [Fibrobacterota bacterium]|nr:MAG: hypothetical protein IPK50_00855 [Fibrobacterota bacterium]
MASSRITLSVDREHYRAARLAATRMETTVSHLTDLFFQTLAEPSPPSQGRAKSLRGAFRGAFRGEIADDSRALVAALKAKHLR